MPEDPVRTQLPMQAHSFLARLPWSAGWRGGMPPGGPNPATTSGGPAPPHRPAFFSPRSADTAYSAHARTDPPAKPTAHGRDRGAASLPGGRRSRHRRGLPGRRNTALDPDDPGALHRRRRSTVRPHDPTGLAGRNLDRVRDRGSGQRPPAWVDRPAPRAESTPPRDRL